MHTSKTEMVTIEVAPLAGINSVRVELVTLYNVQRSDLLLSTAAWHLFSLLQLLAHSGTLRAVNIICVNTCTYAIAK